MNGKIIIAMKLYSKIKEGTIDSNDAIITTGDKNLFEYLVQGLNQRYSDEFFDTTDVAGAFYIIFTWNRRWYILWKFRECSKYPR